MRPEKPSLIQALAKKLQGSLFLILANYQGMTVAQFMELRHRLAVHGAEIHVAKNRFIEIAMQNLGMPSLEQDLVGQNALVTGQADICTIAKVLKTFTKEFAKLTVKSGVLQNQALSADQVAKLADLPSLEVQKAQLLALLLTPATQLVRVLNEPASGLARVLKAHAEQNHA